MNDYLRDLELAVLVALRKHKAMNTDRTLQQRVDEVVALNCILHTLQQDMAVININLIRDMQNDTNDKDA